MKRITQTQGYPEQGAVYRYLSTSDKDCISFIEPAGVTPPGCDTFSTSDNSFGTMPQKWAGDQFIDPFSWDWRWSEAYDIPQDSVFTDLWGNIDPSLQAFIDIEGCYCPGEGIDRKVMAQGVPRFPQVEPLPFAWITGGGGGGGGGGGTPIVPGDPPTIEEACPCESVSSGSASDDLAFYVSEDSAGAQVIGMRGKIKVPYADYTGPFAGCVDDTDVVIDAGEVYIDDITANFAGGSIAAGDGDIVTLKFNWNWNNYPCKSETITDVELSVGPEAYRIDSQGAERSEFTVMLGKVITLDSGKLCFEQWTHGDILLEGVELPQELIFHFTPTLEWESNEPPMDSTFVRLWNGTAFGDEGSDCYPKMVDLKMFYRVLCSSGDDSPGFLAAKIEECLSCFCDSGSGIDSAEDVVVSWNVNDSGNIEITKRLFTYEAGHLISIAPPVTTTISTETCSCPSFSGSAASGQIYSWYDLGGLYKSDNNFGLDFNNAIPAAPVLSDYMFYGSDTTVKYGTIKTINEIMQFICLEDTPSEYAGNAGKYVAVNSAEDAVIFVDPPSAPSFSLSGVTGTQSFLTGVDVSDCEITFTRVFIDFETGLTKSVTETVGLNFDLDCGVSTWVELTDTDSALGTPGQHVVVDSTGNFLTFADVPSAQSFDISGFTGAQSYVTGMDISGRNVTITRVLASYESGLTKDIIEEFGINFTLEYPSASTWVQLGDTASALGNPGQHVVVNSAGDRLVFADVPSTPSFNTSGFTGTEEVITDWTVSNTDIIIKKANVTMQDGLVKNWSALADEIINGSTCSCPSGSDQVGASAWVDLTDTVNAIGTPGQHVVVNSAGILSFEDPPSFSDLVGASTFLELTDTPSVYGNPGQHVVINSAGDGLIFVDVPSFSDQVGASAWVQLTDTVSALGTPGQHVVVNSAGDTLTFADLPSFGTSGFTGNKDVVTNWFVSGTNVVMERANISVVDGLVQNIADIADLIISAEECSCPSAGSDLVGASTFLELTDTPSAYGTAGQYVVINSAADGLVFIDLPSFPSAELYSTIVNGGLEKDSANNFGIDFGNTVGDTVDATDFLIFGKNGTGSVYTEDIQTMNGILRWILLSDTPADFAGNAGKHVEVNSAENALIFVDAPDNSLSAWVQLTDTVSALGTPGQHVVVDSTGNFLTFADLPSAPSVNPFPSNGITSDTDVLISWAVNGSGNIVTTTQLHTYTGGLLTAKGAPVTNTISTEECSCPSDQVGASTFLELTDTPGAYGTAGQYVTINSAGDGLIFTDLPSDQVGASTWVQLNDTVSTIGTPGQHVVVNSAGILSFADLASDLVGASTFLELTDTPSVYTGEGGKYVIVNSAENALIFVDLPSDQIGAVSWVDLNDTVSAIGSPGQHVVVNSAGILSFADLASDLVGASTFLELTDTPGAYGTAGQHVVINSTADGLIFVDLPSAASAEVYSTIVNGGLEKDASNNFGIDFGNTVGNTVDAADFLIFGKDVTGSVYTDDIQTMNGVLRWLLLSDTPADFTGNAGKHVEVNSAENALIFVDAPAVNSVIADDGLRKDGNDDFGMDFANTETTAPVLTDEVFHGTGTVINANTLSDINAILEFIRLTDTPAAYAGQAGKVVVVNGAANALEFVDKSDVTGGPIPVISGFTGTEEVITGWNVSGTDIIVNKANVTMNNGLVKSWAALADEIINGSTCSCPSGGSDLVGASTFLELTDTPGAYGTAGQYVVINSAADGLVFIDLPSVASAEVYSTIVNGGLEKDSSNNFGIDFGNTVGNTVDATDFLIFGKNGTGSVYTDDIQTMNGVLRWLLLSDTPADFAGNAGKHVAVNSAENAVIFVDAPDNSLSAWVQLTDTVSALGTPGQHVVVNSAGDKLVFADVPSVPSAPSVNPFPSNGLTSTRDVVQAWAVDSTGNIQITTNQYTYTEGLLTAIGSDNVTTISTEECSCPSASGGASLQGVINIGGLRIDSADDFGIGWTNATPAVFALSDYMHAGTGDTVKYDTLGGLNDILEFIRLVDTPGAYGTAGQHVAINSTADGLIFVDAASAVSAWVDLTDTVSAIGTPGQRVMVNNANILSFIDAQTGIANRGIATDGTLQNDIGLDFDNAGAVAPTLADEIFHGLADTVNANTLEDINKILTLINLADTPAAYTGHAGKVLAVNGAGNAVEFVTKSDVVDGGGGGGGGATAWIGLTDTDSALGNLGQYVVVDSGSGGKFLTFSDGPTFNTSGYTGNDTFIKSWWVSGTDIVLAKATISVNEGLVKGITDIANVVFGAESCSCPCSCPSGGGGASTFLDLTDTPGAYGTAGQHVVINSTADALVFVDADSVAAYSVIADGGLEKTGNNFGINMNNVPSGVPDGTAKLMFENGGDGPPKQTTLAVLLGLTGVGSTVMDFVTDVTWNGSTGELKKIRRTGVIIQDGLVTNEGTLGSAVLFTASACPSA